MHRVNNGDERNQRLGEISILTDRRDRLTRFEDTVEAFECAAGCSTAISDT